MIFTTTVRYVDRGNRETIEATVDFAIDEEKLKATLGFKAAAENKTGRATALDQAIVAQVRKGSKREVRS